MNDKRYLTKMVGGIMDFFAIYGREHQRTRHTIFDLTMTEYLLQPEIFQGESCNCEVILTGEEIRGQTIFTPNPNSKILVLKMQIQINLKNRLSQTFTNFQCK